MTNEELAVAIKNGDDGQLPQLWEQVRKFIALEARKYMARRTPGKYAWFEIGDLIDSGYFAVCEACRRYDPEQGAFLTMLGFTLRTAFAEVEGTRRPSQRHDSLHIAQSLEAPIYDGQDSQLSLLDCIGVEDREIEGVIESVYTQELRAALDEALTTLPKRERRVLVLRYFFNIGYAEQAAERGVQRQGIAQLASDGIWRIRFNTKIMKNLASFLDDDELAASACSMYAQSDTGAMTEDEADALLL